MKSEDWSGEDGDRGSFVNVSFLRCLRCLVFYVRRHIQERHLEHRTSERRAVGTTKSTFLKTTVSKY